ncbi:MAG: MerR family transcriptional regulator [Bradymonadia bacterium]
MASGRNPLEQPIPEKLQFKIGEVSKLVGVKPYVLRFWESEFSQLRPRKGVNGHRIYSRNDVITLRRIRSLLHERKYTIAGARALLAEGEEAIEAALAARPAEAVVSLSAAEDRIAELERMLEQSRSDLARASRDLEAAEEEAHFWRTRLRASEALRKTWAAHLKGQLNGLAMRLSEPEE